MSNQFTISVTVTDAHTGRIHTFPSEKEARRFIRDHQDGIRRVGPFTLKEDPALSPDKVRIGDRTFTL